MILISHDLSLVRYLADHVAVMYRGRLVEFGTVTEVYALPYHPYTEVLLASAKLPSAETREKLLAVEKGASALEPQVSGCNFASRCPRYLGSICDVETPPEQVSATGHRILCHIPLAELKAGQDAEATTPTRREEPSRHV